MQFRPAYCPHRAAHCPHRTAHGPLRAAHCPLRAAHCPLRAAHRPHLSLTALELHTALTRQGRSVSCILPTPDAAR